MRIALVDSGLGLLAAAARLRVLRPDADLVLSMDPDGMPWGPREPADVAARALACARAALPYRPDVVVLACNTASVHALAALRAELEPELPVVGTVPAVKPAALTGGPAAVWATPATTGSVYQRDLIDRFAAGISVTEVPCPGLADAVQRADQRAIEAAIGAAAARTPAGTRCVVLGCTHYELVDARIAAVVPGATPLGSAVAVAAQTLRRLGAAANRTGGRRLDVLCSGVPGTLPGPAAAYAEGRALLAGSTPTGERTG